LRKVLVSGRLEALFSEVLTWGSGFWSEKSIYLDSWCWS